MSRLHSIEKTCSSADRSSFFFNLKILLRAVKDFLRVIYTSGMDQRVAAVDADGVFLGVNLVVMFQILIDIQEDLPRVFLCKSYGKDVEDIAPDG